MYFQKSDSKLDQAWTIGRVEQVVRSERDDLIRKVVVKYQNHGEQHPQFTDRHVRKLIKLFNVDEHQVQEDLTELQKKIDALNQRYEEDDGIVANEEDNITNDDAYEHGLEDKNQEKGQQEDQSDELVPEQEDDDNDQDNGEEEDHQVETEDLDVPARNTRSKRRQCNCCCKQHCELTFHTMGDYRPYISTKDLPVPCEL